MLKRLLATSVFLGSTAVAISATVVGAAGWAERLATSRMTVLKTDAVLGRFQCAEHQKWMAVEKADLRSVGAGDIVRVEPRANGRAHLVLLRTAAEELTTPE